MASGISLRPSSFAEGGGLIDDVDVQITRARFVSYDYDGKADKPALCLCVGMQDKDGGEHIQYYSAGDLAYFVPSEDPKNEDLNGITLAKVGDKDSINRNTNFALFMNSLVQAGFPEDKLDSGDVRVLEGLGVHVGRVPQPKRSGLPTRQGQDGQTRVPMLLIVTKINSMPGEGKKATGNVASGATNQKTSAPASPPSDDLKDELVGHLIGIFAEKGVSSLKKVEIGKLLFAAIEKTDANRNKLVSMGAKDDVLGSLEGFSYNGSVLTQE